MTANLKGYVFWTKDGGVYSHKVMAVSLDEAVNKLGIKYTDYKVYDLFHITNIETGKVYESFWDYDAADCKIDEYWEKYPDAAIEIIGDGERPGILSDEKITKSDAIWVLLEVFKKMDVDNISLKNEVIDKLQNILTEHLKK